MVNDNEILLYHGSKQIVEYPEIRIVKYNKDFCFGFYCTSYLKQAKRWTTRYTGKGYINGYVCNIDTSLRIKQFEEMTEEWLDFIV